MNFPNHFTDVLEIHIPSQRLLIRILGPAFVDGCYISVPSCL